MTFVASVQRGGVAVKRDHIDPSNSQKCIQKIYSAIQLIDQIIMMTTQTEPNITPII